MSDSRKPSTLRLIASFKLLKGVLLAVAALKVLRLVHEDLELAGYQLAMRLHLDPEGRLVEPILRRLLDVDPSALHHFSVGALAYAGLLLTEGVGLMRGKRWAEYLTVIATSCLVPFEIYELSRRFTVTRLVVAVVNLAIVAYLVVLLRRQRHAAPAAGARRA